ncbi:hypothetical protein CKO40_11545 [Halochromatium glycolicum]|uniref:Uncharacterized protein n=1 Tax=Halochromatium glycolicum TaxID=85075 RepID=A0AAJ0XAS7_9GAMM|nr:hypothetical protein [Halochromatium glycolicum]
MMPNRACSAPRDAGLLSSAARPRIRRLLDRMATGTGGDLSLQRIGARRWHHRGRQASSSRPL